MDCVFEKIFSVFLLLFLIYYGLESFNERLWFIEVNFSNVEDVYFCLLMQCGLLLSQFCDLEKYVYSVVFEVQFFVGEVNLEWLYDVW